MADVLEIQIIATDNASKTFKAVNSELEKTGEAADNAERGTKNYNSSLDNLVQKYSEIIAVGGTVTAVVLGLKKAFEWAQEGATIRQTEESFTLLLDRIGAAPDVLQQLQRASRGTVDDMTLMSSTLTLVAGASDEMARQMVDAAPRILEIAKAANKLNPTLGDTAFLYQSLMTGIKRGSPLLIDNTGLTLKIGKANEDMAMSLGKSVDQLTDTEKQMALLNATMEAGDQLIQQVGGDVDSMTDKYARVTTSWKNYSDSMKSGLADIVVAWDDANGAVTEWILNSTNVQLATKALNDLFLLLDPQVEKTSESFVMAAAEGGLLAESLDKTSSKMTEAEKSAINLKEGYQQSLPIIGAYTKEVTNAKDILAAIKTKSDLAREALDQLNSKVKDASTLMGTYTDELLFNEAAAFLNKDQQLVLAEALGLIDDDTAQAYSGMQELTKAYQSGAISADEYIDMVAELKSQIAALEGKSVFINVTTKYKTVGQPSPYSPGSGRANTPPIIMRQAGGAVAGGGAYMVGEMGPEMFVPYQSGYIVPNQGVSNVTNNWSLTINEAGRRGNVREDFALLRAMAE